MLERRAVSVWDAHLESAAVVCFFLMGLLLQCFIQRLLVPGRLLRFRFGSRKRGESAFASASRVEICTSIGDRVVKGFLGWYCAAAASFPVLFFAS